MHLPISPSTAGKCQVMACGRGFFSGDAGVCEFYISQPAFMYNLAVHGLQQPISLQLFLYSGSNLICNLNCYY